MKTKVPIIVSQWLKDLSFEELTFWASFAKSPKFSAFETFSYKEAERRKNIIWRLPEADPVKLAIEKAALRGGIETIYSLVMMAKGASSELEHRANEK